MEFEWDAANVKHLARHRITTEEVEQVFSSNPVIVDHQVIDEEDRWSSVGITQSLRALVIVFTVRGERVRPITGWEADKETQKDYFRKGGSQKAWPRKVL